MHESSMNPTWIQHECIFSIFSPPRNPNHHSEKIERIFSNIFFKFLIESNSCRLHAYLHLHRIHVRFMPDSIDFSFAIHPYCSMSFSCRFHAYLRLCRIHVKFIPDLVACANPVYRISISDPASAATSFFKTLNGGDPTLTHS